jgi:hypothetical protein
MSFANSKSVHISSPPIPSGNQGADDFVVALGNQKRGRGIASQAFNVIEVVLRRGVPAPLLSP